jgi:hypothetical protein
LKKNKKKYKCKKTLKINENNNIDSIIEIFQRFGNKYNIVTTTLNPNIQYQIKNMKITQTYTTTILNTDIEKMIKKIENEGKITLIIIKDVENNNKTKEINRKIKELNKLENVNTKVIRQKDTFKTLDKIIKEA